ncbi:uncharacterized protein [Hemitrygon akajei]|uniref:uncharacterized protein isoform X6 n=1 Tax=Hemitrygon akajei TaxID=2704970 RepID=UPI003BF9B090
MAMAARWLAEVREQVQFSEGWQEYCKELVDVVLQQLAEGHVNFFTDLSTSEKTLLVDRAAKVINEGSIYKALVSRISSTLEEQIFRHLVGKIQESKPVQTRNEAFQSHIQDGVISLLHKWPDMKSKLRILFNHSLPPDLRKLTWNLYLSNTKVRMEYLSWLSLNVVKSSNNKEILLKCESLLSSDPTFKTLSETNYAAWAMRNVLSYYQNIQPPSMCLSESNYLLLVPLVQVSIAAATQNTTLSSLSTQLVEEYVTFMEWWMRQQVNQMSNNSVEDNCFKEIRSMLDEKDKELSARVEKIYAQQAVRFPAPWINPFRNHLAYRTQPKERRQAREKWKAQHLQYMEETRLIRPRENEERRMEIKRLQRQLENTQQINFEQKISFEEKLCQERCLRYEMQRKAEEQVSQLQVEMRQLMQQRQFSTDASSLRRFIPTPPPSLESDSNNGIKMHGQYVPPEDSKIILSSLTVDHNQCADKVEHVTLDLLNHLMCTTNSNSFSYLDTSWIMMNFIESLNQEDVNY